MNTHGLRYSPVNWLIVDWSGYDTCGLPAPLADNCKPSKPKEPKPCVGQELPNPINTYDWGKFLPNVLVGLDTPDDDIAADYVRASAIDFARHTMVLQRNISVDIQRGVNRYPVIPFEGEQVEGIIAARVGKSTPCSCMATQGGLPGIQYSLGNNEITVDSSSGFGRLDLLVWVAPTEDACVYDALLYDKYRAEITMKARREYLSIFPSSNRTLMQLLPSKLDYDKARMIAKKRALGVLNKTSTAPSTVWATQCCNRYGSSRWPHTDHGF